MELASSLPESVELIEDEKLWLSDGNIVVRAGSGAGEPLHGFKCHRSMLTLSSPVFATMFSLPSSGNARIDGVECVDLPDQWEDVRDLLWCLYGFFDFQVEKRDPNAATYVAGAYRLAKKYDMPEIEAKLYRILAQDWPDSYEDWVKQEKATARLIDEWCQEGGNPLDLDPNDFSPDPAPVVRLARETRTRAVLRPALYDLCRVRITKPSEDLNMTPWPLENVRVADAEYLAPEDICLVAAAREQIRERTWSLLTMLTHIIEVRLGATMGCMDAKSGGSPGDYPCSAPLRRWLDSQVIFRGKSILEDPIGQLIAMQDRVAALPQASDDKKICDLCALWFREYLAFYGGSFWIWLPKAFQFEALGLD